MNVPRPADGGVILFDGVCNFCNATVRFVYARDPEARFRFAPLQSAIGQALLAEHGEAVSLDSVLLVMDGRVYRKSDAALTVARHLKAPWPAMTLFRWVPRGLRDAVYDFIGRHRYQWFGKTEQCPLPPPDLGERFL